MSYRRVRRIGVALIILAFPFVSPRLARAELYGPNSLLVAGFDSGRVAIYDENLNIQGTFTLALPLGVGLDFTPVGNVLGAMNGGGFLRQFTPQGAVINTMGGPHIGFPNDVKYGPGDRLYAGMQTSGGVREFSLAGALLRSFGSLPYDAVAVLPGGVLWASGDAVPNRVDVYDIAGGSLTRSFTLGGGQSDAESMHYSASTNTVLLTGNQTPGVFERDFDGNLVRSFTAPDLLWSAGVTRGPGGDVFATSFDNDRVFRWRADGTFVGSFSVAANSPGPTGIIWAGNAPEPGGALACLVAISAMMASRGCVTRSRTPAPARPA